MAKVKQRTLSNFCWGQLDYFNLPGSPLSPNGLSCCGLLQVRASWLSPSQSLGELLSAAENELLRQTPPFPPRLFSARDKEHHQFPREGFIRFALFHVQFFGYSYCLFGLLRTWKIGLSPALNESYLSANKILSSILNDYRNKGSKKMKNSLWSGFILFIQVNYFRN